MEKIINHEYNEELDILHIYTNELKNKVKGCISIGFSTLDISNDNEIIGIEIEEASKIFEVSLEFLSHLENVNFKVTKIDNNLFIGVNLTKGYEKTNLQLNLPNKDQLVIAS